MSMNMSVNMNENIFLLFLCLLFFSTTYYCHIDNITVAKLLEYDVDFGFGFGYTGFLS